MTKTEALAIISSPLATDAQREAAQKFIDAAHTHTPTDAGNQMLIGLLKRHLDRECCDPVKHPAYRAEIQKQLDARESR